MLTALIIAVVIACVGLAVALTMRALSRRRLRDRFGPEYHRVLAHHDGDDTAARKELSERLSRHGDLTTHQLDEEERERYTERWTAAQERFVDDPAGATLEADRLLADLMRDRGYPADDPDERVDALSVHHPRHVQRYRDSHAVATRTGQDGDTGTTEGRSEQAVDTEELRTSLLHARDVFEELLAVRQRDDASDEGDRDTGAAKLRAMATRHHRHA